MSLFPYVKFIEITISKQTQYLLPPIVLSTHFSHSFHIKALLLKLSNDLIPHPQPKFLSLLFKLLVLHLLLVVTLILILLSSSFGTNACPNHSTLGNELLHCFFITWIRKHPPLVQMSKLLLFLWLWLQCPPTQWRCLVVPPHCPHHCVRAYQSLSNLLPEVVVLLPQSNFPQKILGMLYTCVGT